MNRCLRVSCGAILAASLSMAQGAGISYASADTISSGQWYVNELQLEAAHQIATGEGVVVAVVDSGVDASHPSLGNSVLDGADFSNSASDSAGDGRIDDEGHGTAMASLIVGTNRIAGAAPGAKVIPVRVAGSAKRTSFAAGIQWAVDNGAKVINISGAAPLADPREKRAVDDAIRRDVVVVAGVGNVPEATSVQYPARYSGVLAVAASARGGRHAAVSAAGPEVMISAPGEDISTAWLNHEYAITTGTSDATALISGVVAMVRSRFPTMAAAEVVQRITATAIDKGAPGRDDQYGYGIVDPLAALSASVDVLPARTGSPSVQSRTDSAPASHDVFWARPTVLLMSLVLIVLLVVGGTATTWFLIRR